MSIDSTAREVFEDVDPDPDAVLEAYGAQTPEELVASGGEHEPTTDDELDADDAAADALFGDLSEDSLEGSEPEPATGSGLEAESSSRTESESELDAAPAIDWSSDTETTVDADVVVIEPAVTVQEGDGRAVDRDGTVLERVLDETDGTDETVAARVSGGLASDLGAGSNSSSNSDSNSNLNSADRPSTSRTSTDDLTLVGPDPETVRIDNGTFGAEIDDFVWFGESAPDLEPDW